MRSHVDRRHQPLRAVWWCVLACGAGAVVAALSVVTTTTARAATPSAVAVVIDTGAQVTEHCVVFEEPSISGAEALRRTGVPAVTSAQSIGEAVCALDGVGCPAEDCFCRSFDQGIYWNYFVGEGGDWRYSGFGASNRDVRHGDIEGWRWGGQGVAPPPSTFEQVCGDVVSQPDPEPEPEPEPDPEPDLPPEPPPPADPDPPPAPDPPPSPDPEPPAAPEPPADDGADLGPVDPDPEPPAPASESEPSVPPEPPPEPEPVATEPPRRDPPQLGPVADPDPAWPPAPDPDVSPDTEAADADPADADVDAADADTTTGDDPGIEVASGASPWAGAAWLLGSLAVVGVGVVAVRRRDERDAHPTHDDAVVSASRVRPADRTDLPGPHGDERDGSPRP